MYEHLFESDAAGDQCKFAEAVREQSLFEYNELISDLQTSMVLHPISPPCHHLSSDATNLCCPPFRFSSATAVAE
jgi:hypothetical protein